jgi:hypothetical protein
MWRFRDGRWVNEPIQLVGPVIAIPVVVAAELSLDSTEDVELYAAELGFSRASIHRYAA